jgi:glycosyltransferase involved in cell wall biosynthesis
MIVCCRGFISTNEEVTSILKKLPFYRNRFREIPIASNIIPAQGITEKKALFRKELKLPKNSCVLSHFGLFYPGKGLTTLLECCKLLDQRGFNFFLMLLGAVRKEDNEYVNRIKALVMALNLGEKVKFYGKQNDFDTSKCIVASDIYVVPYNQGASIRRGTLWAGIAHGLPVITTFPSSPSKYITDQNMMLVPPQSPDDLANAIQAIYADRTAGKKLVENARLIYKGFSWESIADRLELEFLYQLNSKC